MYAPFQIIHILTPFIHKTHSVHISFDEKIFAYTQVTKTN